MCQINTDPMISQLGYLQVVVPPDIENTGWTGDLVVREGTNVSLECRARGYPPPEVSWRKEGSNSQGKGLHIGEVLTIGKVSRLHMGAYLCMASNGIPPTVSKRIQLKVQFPPMLWIPNQLEGARLGSTTVLECNTEAFPRSINYWTNHKGEMIAAAGTKYDTMTKEDTYKTYMRLVIHNITHEDFNTYRCIAKNSLGETDGSIKLYEIPREESTQGSLTKAEGEESGDEDIQGGGTEDSPLPQDTENNYATDRRGGRQRGKATQSKKNGIGPNSWRTGDAVNEILSDVDEMFREKEQSHGKDPGYGRETSSSSFDHSFTFDSGASWTRSYLLVFYVTIFVILLLWEL
ncbi:lachesin-like [Penaeus japonicus]|uniref:lachesin-like n=1 Tax=Penaeus japonicus TaxID=27405 RepID=UPI001C70F87A|nr:lachesin-like [Penaeus japonicus]